MADFLRRKRRAGEPEQILDAYFRRRLQHHERDPVAIPQMMMVRDHHAVAQSAFAQRSLEIRNALVAVVGIVLARAHRRCSLAPARLVLGHAQVGNLGLAIDHGRHHASRGVLHQFDSIRHSAPLVDSSPDDQRRTPEDHEGIPLWYLRVLGGRSSLSGAQLHQPSPFASPAPPVSAPAAPPADRSSSIPG